jgi:hypothetical protein
MQSRGGDVTEPVVGVVDFYNGNRNVPTVACAPFVAFIGDGSLVLERQGFRRFGEHVSVGDVPALIRVLETAQQVAKTLEEAS